MVDASELRYGSVILPFPPEALEISEASFAVNACRKSAVFPWHLDL
jgi:hypothetical protein